MFDIDKQTDQIIHQERFKSQIFNIGNNTDKQTLQIIRKISVLNAQTSDMKQTINYQLNFSFFIKHNLRKKLGNICIQMATTYLDLANKINPLTGNQYVFPNGTNIVPYIRTFVNGRFDQFRILQGFLERLNQQSVLYDQTLNQICKNIVQTTMQLYKSVDFLAKPQTISNILLNQIYKQPKQISIQELESYNDTILTKKLGQIGDHFTLADIYTPIKMRMGIIQRIDRIKLNGHQSHHFEVLTANQNIDSQLNLYSQIVDQMT